MKRIAAGMLVFLIIVGCIGCSNLAINKNNTNSQTEQTNQSEVQTDTKQEPSTSDVDIVVISSACDILQKAWDTYEDSDSDNNMYNDKFAVMGGHQESYVLDLPGTYDLSKTSDLERSFCVPTTMAEYVDDVATMMHLMHANTFSTAALHITEDDRVEELVDVLENKLLNQQWLGGSPDKFVIVTIADNYVVVAFGQEEVVDYFKAALLLVYENVADIKVEKNIK